MRSRALNATCDAPLVVAAGGVTIAVVRISVAVVVVLAAGGSRAGSPGFDAAQVSVAPSLSPQAQVRMASVARDLAAFDAPLPSLTWSLGADSSVVLGAGWRGDQLLPSIGLQRRLLAEQEAGVDVAVTAAFRSVAREDAGSEVSFAVQLGRSFGAISVGTSASVGKSTGMRSDVDVEMSSLLAASMTRWAKIGVTARLHGELVDDLETPEDHGRALGLIVAPVLSLAAGGWALDVLAGWERPRGAAPERVMGLVAGAYNF